MPESWEPEFRVGDWRIRPQLHQLERDGEAVQVEPRSMRVLVSLARHAPQVVSKKRIVEEVWGDVFVTDEVISHAIWELRKALGDDAKKPRFIRTIPRKGYLLVAEVSFVAVPENIDEGQRIAQYDIGDRLGGGAMGVVYKARDTLLERTVALKFLPLDWTRDPEARARFLREARAAAALDHPNIATVHEVGETEGGRMFIAMAYYDGGTLKDKLRHGPLSVDEAVGLARQIAAGLAAAHRQGIIHRDVKPANVVVTSHGTAKLLDFGLAKLIDATTLTRTDSSPGTPAYKSPEQTRGEPVDVRADVWAMGVMLYEMLTGRVPFRGEYEQAVIYSILHEDPSPLGESIPIEVAHVVHRALAKDPTARHEHADEIAQDLEGVLHCPAAPVTTEPTFQRTKRFRHPRMAAAVLLLLIVAVVLAWQYPGLVSSRETSPEVLKLLEHGEEIELRGNLSRNLESAIEVYRNAMKLEPENPLVLAHLAACLARFQEPSRLGKIRTLTSKALDRGPHLAMPWIAQAKLQLLLGQPKAAEEAARRAMDLAPESDRGYILLGEALIAQEQLEEGLKQIRRSLEVGKGYIRGGLVLGEQLWLADRYDEAASEFLSVLKFDPEHPTALHNLGTLYLDIGRDSDALPRLRKVYEIYGDARSASNLGYAYYNLNWMNDAIQMFRKAHELAPESPSAAHNLGDSYEKLGNEVESRRWFEMAIDLYDRKIESDGVLPLYLSRRGVCAAKTNRFTDAFSNLAKALDLAPKDTDVLFNAAQVYALAGNTEQVYELTLRAVQAGKSREEFSRDFAFRHFQADPRFRTILESDLDSRQE